MSKTISRPSDDQNAVQAFVNREVHYCVSALVSTLAGGDYSHGADDLGILMDQALELASPIADYEEAAIQAGFSRTASGEWHSATKDATYSSAEDACEDWDLDPIDREVFEHWIVSDWLADKLAEKGEKVDKDFAGLTVWARTTTGQGIASDAVIERIYDELFAKVAWDYETAARAVGWTIGTAPNGEQVFIVGEGHKDAGLVSAAPVGDWQDLCRREHLLPYAKEA